MTGVVVGILVAVGVPKFLHELCRGVPYGKRHRQIAALADFGKGVFKGHIGGVALGRRCQINGSFGKRNAALRHAYL